VRFFLEVPGRDEFCQKPRPSSLQFTLGRPERRSAKKTVGSWFRVICHRSLVDQLARTCLEAGASPIL
jgi:hypothetical protein